MLRRLLIPLLAALAGLLLLGPIAKAEPVFPPGLRIGLTPPDGMALSRRFSGFEDLDRKAAITLLDVPLPAYRELERSAFAKNQLGLTGLKRESFPFGSGIGMLITGTANENGVTVHKWFLLATAAGGAVRNLAMLASAQVPQTAAAIYSDAVIRKALASITFRPMPVQEQLGLLPFRLTDLAGFRVVQVMPAGGVILTDGPADNIGLQPYMIVSVGPGAPADSSDRGRFANDMLTSAPLRGLNIQVAEAMRITGAPGYEIRAQAEGPRGSPVSMVQWIRFSGTGYLRIIGVAATPDWNALFTRFRAVRDGIAFR